MTASHYNETEVRHILEDKWGMQGWSRLGQAAKWSQCDKNNQNVAKFWLNQAPVSPCLANINTDRNQSWINYSKERRIIFSF